MALAPLRQFGLRSVMVTTLQAVSGAGYPGVPSLDILGNVVPASPAKRRRSRARPRRFSAPTPTTPSRRTAVVVSAPDDARAGDRRAHGVDVGRARLAGRRSTRSARRCGRSAGKPQALGLPSAPSAPIDVTDAPDRPQPRLDAGKGGGMTVTVGRVRPCPVLGIKFVAMGHNTIRGAAGAALLNAELMLADGWVD